MYLKSDTLKAIKHLHTSPKGMYVVVENTRREIYEELKELTDEHLPNYLIVNKENGAIEYATDQLPNACNVSGRLEEELLSVASRMDEEAGEDIRKMN